MKKQNFSLLMSEILSISSCGLCGCNKYQALRSQENISIYLDIYPKFGLTLPDSFAKRELVQCLNCRHVYWNQVPKLEALPSFQQEILDYAFDDSRALKNKAALLCEFLPPEGLLVDIGACRGELLKAVRLLNNSASLVGIEPSFSAFYEHEKIKIIQSLFDREADIESNTVDVFSAVDVIEHLPNLDEAFKAIERFIKPGGYLFIESPDGFYHYNKLINYSNMNLFWIEHVSFLTRDSVEYVCNKFNFEIILLKNVAHFKSSRLRKYASMAKSFVINKTMNRINPMYINSEDHLQILLRKI